MLCSSVVAFSICMCYPSGVLQPTGIGVAAVQFDAVICDESPRGNAYAVLFVRYVVSRDSYRLEVLWGEPHGEELLFPAYPLGLRVESTPNEFRIKRLLSAEEPR